MSCEIRENLSEIQQQINFSGSILVQLENDILLKQGYGYANRSEELENNEATRFGIASGCKLFTAIAVSQLEQNGQLSFDDRLIDCLDVDFPHFDNDITVHHLLSHTSGIPDYFDEEVMDDFEELWVKYPMYNLRELREFLPLFQHGRMMSRPGEKFHYNNAGYILLGMIVEHVSKLRFTDYVQKHIFNKAGMRRSGYFSFDSLPANTALGYIDNPDGTWRTNIYSLPVKGGSDGGAFVTVQDMANLWHVLLNGELLDKKHTDLLMETHCMVKGNSYYGYGVWIRKEGLEKYHVMGYDPGVSFHSAYYPEISATVVVCSNKSDGAFDMMQAIEEALEAQWDRGY
ncbi:serine hydrolase domain-containing protein [Virgibacillus siamensis]|uniref:serine hydrolase domain-containing protein n=1 Tax=Virgibacillus siamensis TaxID=480071 RepID=UPI00098672E4|nr:serine hydrolase [Virgibacillus siamensis]